MTISEELAKTLGADLTNGITSEYIQEHVVPPLGIEYVYPIFKKYGYTYSRFSDKWIWNDYALRNASQEELWQMMAIASMYWEKKYMKWYKEDKR